MAKENNKKKVVLLDSHAIIHRAYHAMPDFTSSKGEPTGALYGLSTMLMKIFTELKPDYVIACFDLPGPTYRHEAYEAYKAGRKKGDDELYAQINRARDLFTAFHIPMYDKPGFEADDMLGTIVETLKDNDEVDIVVASGDMDTLQLVKGKKVQVYTLKKGINDTILYDEKAVVERFGFKPELLTDYKGLRGDPSDNIIGIAGIGEKTASTLIQNFGTIENIYKKLKKDKQVFKDVGITDRIIKLLEEGQEEAVFSKTLATIRRDAPIDFKLPEKTWKESIDVEKVKAFFAELEFRTLNDRLRIALAGGKDAAEKEATTQKEEEAISYEAVDPLELKKTGVAMWVVNSNLTNPSLEDVLAFAKTKSFAQAKETIFKTLKERGLEKVYTDIEEPLIPILEKMKEYGVRIDKEYLVELSKKYHKELSSLEKEIWEDVGEEFNINSPKQLGVVLFEKMGLKAKGQKKTASGAMSTKESELEKIKDLHPVVGKILSYRELQKLLSTYIDVIPTLADENDRLHAEFIQTGAATGRMSGQNPNLQNIPIKSELGRNIRKAFIADTGFVLAAFDYSQIELRIAAFLSKDEKLIEIFKNGEDVHAAVAAQVFKVPLEKVDKEMRRKAKVINFGILYGMGVNALKVNLGGERAEAQEFYNQYFETFSKLAAYLDEVKSEANRLGYTETFFGRRRYFEGIKSKLPYIRAMAERMAINAPIQGTQADLIKIAMARIDEYIKKEKLEDEVKMLMQIHDELVFEINKKKIKEVAPEIKKIMEEVLTSKDTLGVPIVANAQAGDNWNEMETIN